MRKTSIAILLGTAFVAAPFSAAMSQSSTPEYAMSQASTLEYRVFIDRSGNPPLTAGAKDTVRMAARTAKSQEIQLQGRADYAQAVRNELVRQGVPPNRISIDPIVQKPLRKAGDDMGDLADRQVIISF